MSAEGSATALEASAGADNPAFEPDEHAAVANGKPRDAAAAAADQGAEVEAAEGEERAQWGSPMEFLMSCIAMSVGLGNIWRFPYTAYVNGGGAFLIPYIFVLIVIGRPLYYLEMGLGQFTSRGCVKIWKLAPALRGVGYGQIAATACVLSYYTSLMALTSFYLVMSFQAQLPWAECRPEWGPCVAASGKSGAASAANASSLAAPAPSKARSSAELYFILDVLREKDDLSEGMGAPDWRLTLCLLVSWLLILGVQARGVRSSGKAAYFLALFPYVVLIVLLVRGCTLPGAGKGILFFIEPKWEQLAEAKVWYAAVTQAFFSLNVGFGSLINYASYNSFRHNIYRDAMIVTTLDTFTSLLAGCTTFAILGNLAYEMGIEDIGEVVTSGTGLAFVSYPDAIAKFDWVPQLFAVLFFFMLLTLGLGSAVALLSAIVTIVTDNFPNIKLWVVNTVLCVAGFLIGLVYVTPGGQWILTLVDHFGATYPVLALMCIEMTAIAWLYGLDRICSDFAFMLRRTTSAYWRFTWGLITPVFLIAVFVYAAVEDEKLEYGERLFPDHYYVAGWALLGVVVGACPCFVLIEIGNRWLVKKMAFCEAVRSAFSTSSAWGPSDALLREHWQEEHEEQLLRSLGEGPMRTVRRAFCGAAPSPDAAALKPPPPHQ